MEVKQGYDYDDVLLIPKHTDIEHRAEVNIRDAFGMYPIFSSPMKGLSNYEFVNACVEANIYGILHRFDTFDNRIRNISKLCALKINPFGVAVGIDGEKELSVAKYAYDCGADIICVDIANGYLGRAIEYVEKLSNLGIKNIMAGNVVTKDGADALYESGANHIRVGIGGGSLCSTRNVTGVGFPDLSAIEEVNLSRYRDGFSLVADGGIRNSGNAVKAYAVGADYVMLGRVLMQSYEAEHDGTIYGMASEKLQKEYHGTVKSVEGLEDTIEKIGTLKDIVDNFMNGIRSACTYLNSHSYDQIQYNANFISAGKGSLKNL